jgi:hypothetical protein
MTDPVQPTPAAPAEPTTAPTTTPPTEPGPARSDPASAAFDPSSLSADARAWLDGQVRAADLKARQGSKANAAREAREELMAEVAKSLGLDTAQLDAETLQAQLEEMRDQVWAAGLEREVNRVAAALGADAESMLDSRKFVDSLDDLAELDPRSSEFKEKLEAKVREAAAKYPAKPGGAAPAGPRPDPTQGARTGQASRPTTLTQAVSAVMKSRT